MLTKRTLQRLAEMRLEDAILLLREHKSSSAYYLAGYSVELGLKACISKLFQSEAIPDKNLVQAIHTHSLEKLMSVSGLQPQFKAEMKADPVLASHWGVVTKWNESSRYKFWDPAAAATLIHSIIDEDHGVLTWVKRHW